MSVTLKLDDHDAVAIAVALECMASGFAHMVWDDNGGADDRTKVTFYDGMMLTQGEHLIFEDGNSEQELNRLAAAFYTAVKANAPDVYGLKWPDPDVD